MDKKLYDDRKDCLKNDFCAREVMETHDNGTRDATSLYSDRDESLAGVFGNLDTSAFDAEKIMERALLMPRINWRDGEMPDAAGYAGYCGKGRNSSSEFANSTADWTGFGGFARE